LKLRQSSGVNFDLESTKKLSSAEDDKAYSLDDIVSHSLDQQLRKSKSFHNILPSSTLNVYYSNQELLENPHGNVSQQPTRSNIEQNDQPSQPALTPLFPSAINPSRRRVQEDKRKLKESGELRLRGKVHGETCSQPLSVILDKKEKILKESIKRDKNVSPEREWKLLRPKLTSEEEFKIVIVGKFQRYSRTFNYFCW
jgi:hypothetical protein